MSFTHRTNGFAPLWFTYPAPVSSGSSRDPLPEVYRGRPRWRMSVWTRRSPGCRWSSEPGIGSLSRHGTWSPSFPDTVGWVHSGGSHRPSSWPDQTSTSQWKLAERISLPPPRLSLPGWHSASLPARLPATFFPSLRVFSGEARTACPPLPPKGNRSSHKGNMRSRNWTGWLRFRCRCMTRCPQSKPYWVAKKINNLKKINKKNLVLLL